MSQMLEGALVLLTGIVIGRVVLGCQRALRPLTALEPICGCEHGLHDHDPESKQCHGVTEKLRYNHIAEMYLSEDVPCTCRQFVGSKPLPTYTTEITG